MTYHPRSVSAFHMLPPFMGPWGREGYAADAAAATAPSSGAWAATNTALYFPIVVPSAYTIRRFWWLNGATVGTNNLQVGLYGVTATGMPGAAILRGTSTLSAGANVCQFDDVTDTTIPPGRYWLAMWGSGTTATVVRLTTAQAQRSYPQIMQSSLTTGLPATALAVPEWGGTGYLPVFGMTNRATP